MKKIGDFTAAKVAKVLLSIFFAIISVVYVFPVFMVLLNSFKGNTFVKTETFAFLNKENFVGLENFIKGMTFGGYPFWKSVVYSIIITVLSSALILAFTSMAAWYISRVDSRFCRLIYFLCVFSMVVPFQMVMFTLAKTADTLKLNTPWTIPVIYLGFGAGLAVFMFVGFVKSIPISIVEIMWVWNDYLLPYLVLDMTKYRTLPIHIQYLKGSYGTVDLGATMALILLSIVPVIVFYLLCQKHIIKGVAAGAVKG